MRAPRLRVRLFLMVVLLAAPAFALLIFDSIEDHRRATDDLEQDAQQAAHAAALDHAHLAQRLESAMATAALTPALQGDSGCDDFLSSWLARIDGPRGATVTGPGGASVCSAGDPVPNATAVWHDGAMAGDFVLDATGDVLVYAYPVPPDAPERVLAVAVPTAVLADAWAAQGARIAWLDAEGALIASAGDIDGDVLTIARQGEGTYRSEAGDAVAVQALTDGGATIAVLEGDGVLAIFSVELAQQSVILFTLAGAMLFALGVVWNRMIAAPLRALERGALALKKGHHLAPVSSGPLPRELHSVADAFDAMADEVQRTRLQLERKVLERTVELRQRNDDLQRATRYKSEFLANMSHEIRTPLNAVIGMANVLADMDLGDDERRAVETIKLSGHHLLTVISDILDISRIEAGRMDLEDIPLSVRETVEESVALVAPQARSKHVDLGIDIDDDVPEGILGDAGRLRQILVNLAGNAVKFTDEGHVLVKVQRHDEMLRFIIEDTGPGVPEDLVGELFTPFHQLPTSETRRFSGTGLGLTISQRLVHLMEGRIGYDADGPGATFWVDVPCRPAQPTMAAPWVNEDVLSGRRVLLVDDHDVNLEVIGHQLTTWGLRVDARTQSRAALDEAISHPEAYDAILVDVLMPGLDGAAFTQRLRAAIDQPPPVLLLSSTNEEPAVDAPMLQKPVRSADLYRALCRIMDITSDEPTHHVFDAGLAQRAPLRILIAEDSTVNQRVALAMLERFGYTADVAGDGRAAIDMAQRTRYDLIFMDLEMPIMGGREAAQQINDAGSRARIVAMTAHVSQEDRRRCAEAGMQATCPKPVSVDGLAKELKAAAKQMRRVGTAA